MLRARVGASRGLRWGILALSTAFLVVTIGSDDADARSRQRRTKQTSHKYTLQQKHKTKQASQQKRNAYQPPYAAIVVDANSGLVLHAANPDAQRHPASITKIMTLYLLFEQIESGKLRLDSSLPVSAYAASQAPSKLGLKPGQTIQVEDAIKALVTKSANDVAVVVAEAIAGGEAEFAKLMTRKARALGMSQTVYTNASGLPDDDQITTVREQAQLGRAIQDRFPRYYRYFSTASFRYGGHAIRNHNHLLGRVAGVDGIKTGFIRASGFNLVASVRRGNRHLVAVVIGGASANWRDARMSELIEAHVTQGATERTAAKIVEAPSAQAQVNPSAVRIAAAQPGTLANGSAVAARAAAAATPTPPPPAAPQSAAAPRPAPGSTEPIAAIPVKTLAVRASTTAQNAAMAALAAAAAGVGQAQAHAALPTQFHTASATATPATAPTRSTATSEPAVSRLALPAASAAAGAGGAVDAGKTPPRGSWIIQIGAFPDESEARERLQSAQNMAKAILGHADAFTERVTKGPETLYRARFAGLDEDSAEAACRHFKRNKIDCFAVKN
jgi:D-alanyl-D-alanine carboxypeptidase